jgi:hypothetical protein
VANAPCVLAKRISLLDSQPIYADLHGDLDPDLAHFIRTIEAITPPGSVSEQLPTASASAADEKQSMSELVAGLEAWGTCIGMHFRFYKAQASRGKGVSFRRWMARGQDCMTVGTVAVQWPRLDCDRPARGGIASTRSRRAAVSVGSHHRHGTARPATHNTEHRRRFSCSERSPQSAPR